MGKLASRDVTVHGRWRRLCSDWLQAFVEHLEARRRVQQGPQCRYHGINSRQMRANVTSSVTGWVKSDVKRCRSLGTILSRKLDGEQDSRIPPRFPSFLRRNLVDFSWSDVQRSFFAVRPWGRTTGPADATTCDDSSSGNFHCHDVKSSIPASTCAGRIARN